MYENHALEAKKIEILQRQLDDQYRHDKSAALLLKLGFFLTFLLYLMFNQHLYLGDATTWGEYLKDGTTAAGFGFMVLLVSLMALFLAWVKHHAYLHFGFFGQVGTVVVVVIGFALFAEFFSSSANQDVKSGLSLKNNEAYQQTLTATQGAAVITPNARLAEKIAEAQKKYNQCEEKLKQGREPHCKGDKGKLDGLLAAEARATAAQKQASVEQLQTNYARQDKLKADSYNPVIVSFAKFFAQTFGGNYEDWIKTAVVVVMLIVAVCFEILHHWLSKSKEASYRAIQGLELELAKLTGSNDYQDFDNSRPTPKEKTPMGFGTPAIAQFKYQQQQPDNKPAAGFIRTDAIAKTEKPTTKKKDSSSTWNAELAKTGIDSPSDPAMNRHADKAQIDRILATGQQPLDTTRQLGIPSESSGLTSELEQVSESLYPVWRESVKSKQSTHAKASTQKFIWRNAGTEKETLTAPEAARIWKVWQLKGLADGLLKRNPAYKPGNRKPEFVLA